MSRDVKPKSYWIGSNHIKYKSHSHVASPLAFFPWFVRTIAGSSFRVKYLHEEEKSTAITYTQHSELMSVFVCVSVREK